MYKIQIKRSISGWGFKQVPTQYCQNLKVSYFPGEGGGLEDYSTFVPQSKISKISKYHIFPSGG